MSAPRQRCLSYLLQLPAGTLENDPTNNVAEQLFEEVKKRYHKMNAAYRNESRCLLMFFAIVRSLRFKRIPMSP